MNNNDLEKTIIGEFNKFQSANDEGMVWITQGLMKATKLVVQKAKRFYHGVYRDQSDRNKLFIPYTKTVIDSMISNLDFDVKDILVTSRQNDTKNIVALARELLNVKLAKYNFGQSLNEMMINYCRDGVVVTRTTEENGHPCTDIVDLENFWTDFNTNRPTRFLERILKPRSELPADWNVKEVETSQYLNLGNVGQETKAVELYRGEGLFPMWYITGNPNHTESKWMVIYFTKTGTVGVHDIKILGDNSESSTYDFAQYMPSNSSFISQGLAEACFDLQEYLNLIYNNRKDKSNLASKGAYLIKKGAGITPDLLSSIRNGGGIPVNNMTDIQPLNMPQTGNDNFLEEQRILDSGQRLTGITPISQGLQDKSGATLGEVNLTAGFSNVRFKFQRQNFAFMVQRIIKRWLKIIIDNMDSEEVIRVSDEKVRAQLAQDAAKFEMLMVLKRNLKEVGLKGVLATIQNNPMNSFFDKHFQKNGFKLLKKSVKDLDYDINVQLTNENVDTAALTKNLIQLIQLAPSVPGMDTKAIIEKTYSVLGIPISNFINSSNTNLSGPQAQQAVTNVQ